MELGRIFFFQKQFSKHVNHPTRNTSDREKIHPNREPSAKLGFRQTTMPISKK
jgi:hypothetical protein